MNGPDARALDDLQVPTFSIVIPVRNGESTIERTLRSCAVQSSAVFEVIVVDNGSSDRTAEIVQAQVASDPRFRMIHVSTPGRSRARNVGMAQASGRWLIFLDADDELAPDRLANTERVIDAQQLADAVQCATVFLRDNQFERRLTPYSGSNFHEMLRVGNLVPIHSMAVRRERADRFPLNMEHCEDWVFWLRTLRQCEVVTYDKDDAIVHLHAGQTSTDTSAMRGWELVVSLWAGSKGLPSKLRLQRRWRQFVDLVLYREGRTIPEVEKAIRRSWFMRVVDTSLRPRPLSNLARAIVRRRLGV